MSNEYGLAKLVDEAKTRYGLPEVVSAEFLGERLDAVKCVLLCCRDHSYVMRPFRTENKIQNELYTSFLQWSSRSDLPLIPRVVPTADDASVTIQIAGAQWWLSQFIEADPAQSWRCPVVTKEGCFAAGRALLLVHQALRRFEIELHQPLSGISRVRDRVLSEFETVFAEPEYLRAREILKSALNLLENDSSDVQLVHGDIHPGNVLMKNGEVTAVIDYEYLHYEQPGYDVGYAAVMYCTNWSNGAADGKIDWNLLGALLAGYPHIPAVTYVIPNMVLAASICAIWLVSEDSRGSDLEHFLNVINNLQTSEFMRKFGNV